MMRILLSFFIATITHLALLFFLPLVQPISPPLISGSSSVSITLQSPISERTERGDEATQTEPVAPLPQQDTPVEEKLPQPPEPAAEVVQTIEPERVLPRQIRPRIRKKSFTIPKKEISQKSEKATEKNRVSRATTPVERKSASTTLQSMGQQKISSNDEGPAIIKAIPNYRKNPKPSYPSMARRRGWQGTVLLAVTVLEDGSASHVKIERSCNYEILDKAALKAVRQWEFIAGTQNGVPQRMEVLIPVHFRLN